MKKRKESPLAAGRKPSKKVKRAGSKAENKAEALVKDEPDKDGDSAKKSKRVRTGCLTCRERHLKCDEGMPECNNCKKSNRECKRGLRLNFIDTWAETPPTIVTLYGTRDWRVEFQDESREIANEYQGGLQKYKPFEEDVADPMTDPSLIFDYAQMVPPAPTMAQMGLPPIQNMMPEVYPDQNQRLDVGNMFEPQLGQDMNNHLQPPHSTSTTHSNYSGKSNHSSVGPGSVGSFHVSALTQDHNSERKDYLDNAQETLYMQVFVEEVGLWMDSMDPHKHFSRLLPFHSLSEPMLLNAFLACGARHLALVNPIYSEDTALDYYNTATSHLLQNLQNPNRDTVVCATTAVILNVYEIMSERATQRMNHIAGARALIKECGWNAKSQGIGAACFWLNVGLEVMSCLHFNWQTAWSPDDWGVDMEFTHEHENGKEEIWAHRVTYIIAKVCNFRATIGYHSRDDHVRMQGRLEEWTKLKGLADAWNNCIPRTMHPMAYIQPHQTAAKSAFPEVWLVKRGTIVARLFYHTAQLLLAQTHPFYGSENSEMAELQLRHAQQICGIAAHVKDRGVASAAIRSLAHAGEVLTKRHEQEEIIQIFEKINKETGWRVGFVYKDLKEKWGWNEGELPHQFAQTHTAARQQKEAQAAQQRYAKQAQAAQSMREYGGPSMNLPMPQTQYPAPQHAPPQPVHPSPAPSNSTATTATPRKLPQGITNPMYAKADFNLPQHPYQQYYVAPNPLSASWNPTGSHMFYNLQ